MDNTTLKSSITRMLKDEFPNCKVYKDKQGTKVKLPAFFVRYISVSQQDRGRGFFEQNYLVEIRHRPDASIPANELNTYLELTGGQVVDLLNVVKDNKSTFSVRALNLESKIEDGVLIVIGSYQILRKRITEAQEPYMQKLEENQKIRK